MGDRIAEVERMSKVALVVALLAAGLAGWTAFERECLRGELARVDEAQQGVEARLAEAERALAQLRAGSPPEVALLAAPGAPGGTPVDATTPGVAGAGGPSLATTQKAPATVEQRLAQLEKELAAARTEKGASKDEGAAPAPFVLSSPRFLGSLEQAEKQLKLDAAQKAGLERVIDEVERDLDALATRRNDEGKTLKELQEAFRPAAGYDEGGMGEEGMAKFHEHMAALARFRASKVPGTNETFAEAERRIRKEGKARARAYLSPEQAKTWDRSHVDPLFRGGSGGGDGFVVTSFEAGPAIQVNVAGR
jgi:hypothetical protein